MKQYELLVIFKPNADSDEVEKLISKVSSDVETLGGKTDSVEKIGRKKLAYEIKNFRDGFFSSMVISLPAENVAEFKRQLRLNDSVLRTMFIEKSVKFLLFEIRFLISLGLKLSINSSFIICFTILSESSSSKIVKYLL